LKLFLGTPEINYDRVGDIYSSLILLLQAKSAHFAQCLSKSIKEEVFITPKADASNSGVNAQANKENASVVLDRDNEGQTNVIRLLLL
jgi:DICT domain-containing protein